MTTVAAEKGKTMSDLIERDKAINILDVIDVDIIPYADTREFVQSAIDYIRKELEELPSARPKGEWKPKNHHTDYCSNCGFEETQWRTADYNFCPSCGAQMKGADDERVQKQM